MRIVDDNGPWCPAIGFSLTAAVVYHSIFLNGVHIHARHLRITIER